jgi:hypothetical protein
VFPNKIIESLHPMPDEDGRSCYRNCTFFFSPAKPADFSFVLSILVSPEQAVQRAYGRFQSTGGRFPWLLPGGNIWFRFVELGWARAQMPRMSWQSCDMGRRRY